MNTFRASRIGHAMELPTAPNMPGDERSEAFTRELPSQLGLSGWLMEASPFVAVFKLRGFSFISIGVSPWQANAKHPCRPPPTVTATTTVASRLRLRTPRESASAKWVVKSKVPEQDR
jgi:hypothetical protein